MDLPKEARHEPQPRDIAPDHPAGGAGHAHPAAAQQSFTEDFTTTTYKDVANTTADWNTVAGELRLFPFAPTLASAYNTTNDASGVAIAGDYAFVAADSRH